MQQAIKLLQLSSLELAQEVQAKLDSNPLLERIEDDEDDYDSYDNSNDETLSEFGVSLTLDSWNQNTSVDAFSTSNHSADDGFDYANGSSDDNVSDSLDKLQQASFDDEAIDNYTLDGDDYSGFNSSDYASAATGSASLSSQGGDENFDSYQGSTSATIQDHVRWQLNFKRLSEIDALIAQYLSLIHI